MTSNAVVKVHHQPHAPGVQSATQRHSQYLTFMLGAEMFAIGILHVKEIIEYGTLTAVPMMPGFIRGVINLRGTVVPVVDLANRFGGMSSEITRRSCIVIVELRLPEGETPVLGVVVDSVSAVLDIDCDDIEPTPSFGTRIRTDFIAGMAKVADKFVILLDVDSVLSMDEMTALSGVAAAGAPDA